MSQLLKASWHWIVIALLIGFASGAFFSRWYAHDNFHPRPGKGDMKQHMLEQFNRKLNLTEEQKGQMIAIFDAHHPQMVALHDEMRPKFEAIKNETSAQIRAILTPEQQKKFDRMKAQMEQRRQNPAERFGP